MEYAVPALALAVLGGTAQWVLGRQSRFKNTICQNHGLEVLYDPGSVNADIVCVHGLGGDAKRTWTTKNGEKEVNWPRDLLPVDIPDARVMTFGYEAVDLRSSQYLTQQTLYGHADRLLKSLVAQRAGEIESRPIIFVGHSLGGLVIKSALIQSSAASLDQDRKLISIQLSTVGVLFFGTPDQNSPHHQFGRILGKIVRSALGEPSETLLQSLDYEAKWLKSQLERFKSIEPNIQTFYFAEQRHVIKPSKKHRQRIHPIVVDEESICPASTARLHRLERVHSDLCKFGSRDTGYVKVIDCIRLCLKNTARAQQNWSEYQLRSQQTVMNFRDDERFEGQIPLDVHEELEKAQKALEDSNFSQAADHFQRALTWSESTKDIGVSHPLTLQILEDLADANSARESFEIAGMQYQRLYVSMEQLDGQFRGCLVRVLKKMAEVSKKQGHYLETSNCLQRLLEIQKAVNGVDDAETVKVVASLAIMLDLQGRFAEAELRYLEAANSRKLTLGANHPDTLKVLENLASNYRMQQKYSKAAKKYLEVLTGRANGEDLKKKRPLIMQTAVKLADMYASIGKEEEAKIILRQWRARGNGEQTS